MSRTKGTSATRIKKHGFVSRTLIAGLCVAFSAGCSTTHYKNKADKEIYGSIEKMQEQVFGEADDFSINTRYSNRDPKEILASELIQERMEEGKLNLTLEDALKIAVEFSREYQTEKENLYFAALRLSDTEYSFSNIFGLTGSPNIERESGGSIRGEAATQARVGRFMKSGGRVSATLANDLVRYLTGDPRRALANTLTVSLSQPLLRGAGRDIVSENLTQGERSLVYAIRDYTFFQNEFAVGIVNDYFRLIGQKDTIRNNYKNYESNVVSRKRASERSLFMDAPIAKQLAIQSELQAKNRYISSVIQYLNSLDSFKVTLGVPLTVEVFLDDSALRELEAAGMQEIRLEAGDAFKIAVESHLNVLNEIDRFEDSKRKINVAANDLLPGLDIDSSASLDWDKEENYREFNVDEVRANMGLTLDLPFDRWRERNDYRETLIRFESEIRSLARTLDLKRNQIEVGLRNLEGNRNIYQNNLLEVENAKEREAEQKLRADAGQVNPQTLIDAQNDLIRAENALVTTLVNVLRDRLQLRLDVGVIETSSENFWLQAQILAENATEPAAKELQPDVSGELIPPEELFK
jgi:hypothetical protein